MKQEILGNQHNAGNYSRIHPNYQLKYDVNEAEGECTMISITPIRFISWRFILYIISNVFLFVPLLLTYWNDKYKRIFYYQFCDLARATHIYIVNYDEQVTIVKKELKNFLITQNNKQQMYCFVNRYMTYLIDKDMTVKLSLYDYKQRIQKVTNTLVEETGLTESQAYHLKYTYGPGTMVIRKPTILELIVKEIIQPLYIFLIFSVLFWYLAEGYYYFATTLLVVFLIGVVINLYQMVQLFDKIFKMAYYEITLNALRDGQVKPISSLDIVPGDIVFLKDPLKIPFEGIILEGSALINQCALTGESVPVVKKADSLDRVHKNPSKVDKNAFIYEGTTIIQVSDKKRMAKYEKYRQSFGIPVCVTRTNFVTTKGQLIRIILFPREQQNVFQREAVKFLFFLFALAVTTYVIVVAINWQYQDATDIIIKFVDLILIAVPPALPVSMTFGIIYAIQKLNKKSIFCIAQNKVITGGMIEFSCFDKTGTLTQDYMDFYCAVPSYQAKFHTQIVNTEELSAYMIENVGKKPYYLPILNNMATNHSIIKIESTGQLIGDPMEIKLFNFGNFKLNQSPADHEAIFAFQSDRGHHGAVYRRYQFESQLQRMSVVAKSSLTQNFQVFAKGSPEMMLNVMKPSSVPKNYNQMLKEYASHGFRVLAVASKPITEQQMKTLSRQDIERDLIFNGFEVFENKLKPQTKGAIQELKSAKIGCVMITGDNTLTGSNISYKCSISDKNKSLIIVDYVNKKLIEENFIFHDYDNTKDFPADKPIAESYIEDDIRKSSMSKDYRNSKRSSLRQAAQQEEFQPMKDTNQEFMFNLAIKAEETNCQLCVTGRAFNELFSGSVEDIKPVHKKFMQLSTVFARTKPNDKAKIVMVFQQMGKRVSMCGDGANDCGALKQADIGLSLSQAQASISAPFTSQVTNISSMVQLIKQCRAGLATNFSLFNIMAIYSLIQFTTTCLLQIFLQYSADFQFLYWDIVLNFLPIVFIGYTATADKLSIQKPRSTLFSITNISQILIMFAIQFSGQIFSILVFNWVEPDYYAANGGFDNGRQNYADNDNSFVLDGVEANATFVFINNMYIISVLAFSISHPWRKQFWTNIPFLIVTAIAITANILICMVPEVDWSEFLIVHLQTTNVRFYLLIASLGYSILIYVLQKFVFEPVTYRLIKKYQHISWI